MNKERYATPILFVLSILLYQEIMAQNEYTIKIEIQKPRAVVWEALTDFGSYSKWNTVLDLENNDRLEVGKKFQVTITDEKGKKSRFKALTLTKLPNQSFSARQVIIANWFFSATHHFIIEEKNPSSSIFTQTWKFNGILFKPFRKMIFRELDRFIQMNNDLKAHLDD